MAIVRVLTTTAFSSDDFWGPADAGPGAVSTNPGTDQISTNHIAYGLAGVTRLTFQLTPEFQEPAYSGSYSSITARAGATDVATATFTPPVAIAWSNFSAEVFSDEDLNRNVNPNLPSLRFAGADDMQGNSGGDVLRGHGGDDLLDGRGGNDLLVGGDGNDAIIGGTGVDSLFGGAGNDAFFFNQGDVTPGEVISGSEGPAAPGESNALIVSGVLDFTFVTIVGIQVLAFSGAGGASVTFESLAIGPGRISSSLAISGSAGADTLNIASSTAVDMSAFTFASWDPATDQIIVNGNASPNTIVGSSLKDILNGNAGNDTISGGAGDDTIDGGSGASPNTLHGDAGADYLTANGDMNVAFGDADGDQLFFMGNQNQLFGGEGNDWLGVSGSGNALAGGAGDEWMGATGSGNTVAGQDGNDTAFASGNSNALHGENGGDWVGASGTGNSLFGGAGNDYVAATGNNNVLDGGTGNDTLEAAAGHTGDTYVFAPGYGFDTALNFAGGAGDRVDLRGWGIDDLAELGQYVTTAGDGSTILAITPVDFLTMQGVAPGTLQSGWFIFS